MQSTTGLILLLLIAGAFPLDAAKYDAFDLMDEVESLMEAEYWPGFSPGRIPVAIFDGERTLLFKHPHPPDGFFPLEGRANVHFFTGQHPQVKANTAIEIGGVACGTFLLEMVKDRPLKEAAGVVYHECFHVWQKDSFPDRWPNSANLFTYPIDDVPLLSLRRLETEALRRSLEEIDRSEGKSWLALALLLRTERMAKLSPESSEWERGVELIEGTASYVESSVAGRPRPDLPKEGFSAGQVRKRAYLVGHAWALWLDKLSPGWKERLKEADPPWLDRMLSADWQGPRETAQFTKAELDAVTNNAEKDAAAQRKAKVTARTEFLGREGWTLVIECKENTPLWPRGFDPMNVTSLDNGEVLHTRWLRLGNDNSSFEVTGLGALTEPAGAHPLFGGVKRVTVTGLATKPELKIADEAVSLDLEGVTFTFTNPTWDYEGRALNILLK